MPDHTFYQAYIEGGLIREVKGLLLDMAPLSKANTYRITAAQIAEIVAAVGPRIARAGLRGAEFGPDTESDTGEYYRRRRLAHVSSLQGFKGSRFEEARRMFDPHGLIGDAP